MPIDRVISRLDTVRERWNELERDWQSVVLSGVLVVVILAFELRIPW